MAALGICIFQTSDENVFFVGVTENKVIKCKLIDQFCEIFAQKVVNKECTLLLFVQL